MENFQVPPEISIVFEHEDFVIVQKPEGALVHPAGNLKHSSQHPALSDWFEKHYPDSIGVGEPMKTFSKDGEVITARSGVVHRLDRDTSGLLVMVKNQAAFSVFKEMFQNRTITKKYHAFVYGNIKHDTQTIDASIGRSRKDFRMFSAHRGKRGNLREAITELKVLKRFSWAGDRYTYIEMSPKTGRTHQLRVHAKYIHNPIVSDHLYAGKRKPALGFSRQALHAHELAFTYKEEDFHFTSQFPPDFMEAQKLLD